MAGLLWRVIRRACRDDCVRRWPICPPVLATVTMLRIVRLTWTSQSAFPSVVATPPYDLTSSIYPLDLLYARMQEDGCLPTGWFQSI